MVNYLPSQATRSITVTSLDVATSLTVNAPTTIPQGVPFLIQGELKRSDTGASLSGETIALSYNGTPLGSTTTRLIGDTIQYELQVSLDTVGSFTLKAEFAGSTRPGLVLLPSNARTIIGIPGIPEIPPLIWAAIIGGILVGGYLIAKSR